MRCEERILKRNEKIKALLYIFFFNLKPEILDKMKNEDSFMLRC